MPKLPVLSGAELIDVLQELGFEQMRQRGSHVVSRRDSVGCVVPLQEIKSGTLTGILRQARLSRDDLLKVLR